MFYYTFSVINTMFVPCTALLYDSTLATQALKLSTTLLSISCGIHLISLLMVSSLACGLAPPHYANRTLEYLRHNFPFNRLISRQTDNPGYPVPKISTCLTIFWGDTQKTEFVKTIHRQERKSSEEKSDGFRKKCSIQLLLCRVCVCVCVCVCVFTSIHREGFICLEQLGLPGNRSTMLC